MKIKADGVLGNERLTATTGLALLALLAVEGFTVLNVRDMFRVHAFVGLLVLPPIGLKLLSTGYRFVGYYSGNPAYRQAGPPHPLLRVTAPFLVLCTVALFGSGVLLLLQGPPGQDVVRTIHSASFFVWFGLMSIHVLTYVWRSPGLVWADIVREGDTMRGALTRESLVAGSVLLGVIVGLVFLPLDSNWVSWFSLQRFGG